MISWSAHLGPLFTEHPLLERFAAARGAGFERVECWSPFDEDLDEFAAAVKGSGVRLLGINLDSGDMPAGDRGFLNRPDQREEVLENAEAAVELAAALDIPFINALVGNSTGAQRDDELATVAERLHEVAELAAGSEVTILVEALNPDENPAYLIRDVDEACVLLGRVRQGGLALLFDAYHATRAGRDVLADFANVHDHVAHIHVADCPGRHEPGSGSFDLERFFATVADSGYRGAVGLEYLPTGTTEESLGWLPRSERGESSVFPAVGSQD